MHQTYDLVSVLEENEMKNVEHDNDVRKLSNEPKIKDFKCTISYLEKLQKFSAKISN